MRRLNTQDTFDTIGFEDMRKLYAMKQLEQSYTFPTKPSSDGFYHMYVKDKTKSSGRRAIKAKTLEGLKEKLYNSTIKTFGQVYEISEAERLKFVKNDERLCSVRNSQIVHRQTYNRFFAGSKLESMPITEISKQDIEDFCFTTLTKYNITKKTFLAVRGVIKQALRYAFEQYYIQDNVYERVNFSKYNDMLVSPVPIEQRVHTEEEVDAILAELQKMHKDRPGYITAWALELQIRMGLRRGEVSPLLKTDIHDGFISINKEQITLKKGPGVAKTTDRVVHHTKTYKDRIFPITKELREFFDAYLPIVAEYNVLFPAKTPNGIISNRAAYLLYQRICKKLGIELSKECVKGTHSFRRNQITKVANATGDLVLASQMFGNSPDVIRSNYYTGYDLEKGRAALEG